MKIGDKLLVYAHRDMYDADGEIIGETPKFWKVEIKNYRTFGELWEKQVPEIKYFHKDNLLQKGYFKGLKTGDIISIQLKNKS